MVEPASSHAESVPPALHGPNPERGAGNGIVSRTSRKAEMTLGSAGLTARATKLFYSPISRRMDSAMAAVKVSTWPWSAASTITRASSSVPE